MFLISILYVISVYTDPNLLIDMSLREKIQESRDAVKQATSEVKKMSMDIISTIAKAFREQIVNNVLSDKLKEEYIAWIINEIKDYDTVQLNRYLTKQKPPYFIDVDTNPIVKTQSRTLMDKFTDKIKKNSSSISKTEFNTSELNQYMKEIHNRVIKVIDNLLKKDYVQYSIETAFHKTMSRMSFKYDTKLYQFEEMLKDDFFNRNTNTIKKSVQISLLNNRCGKNKTAKKPKKIKGGTLVSKSAKVMIFIKPIAFLVRKEIEKWLKRAMNHGLCEVIETMMNDPRVVHTLETKTKRFIDNISLDVSLDRALVLFNPKFNTTVKNKGGRGRSNTAKKRMYYGGRIRMPKTTTSNRKDMKKVASEDMKKFSDIKNPENIISSITNEKGLDSLKNPEQYQEHINKMTKFMESLQPRIKEKSKSFLDILESDYLAKVFHTGLDRYFIESVFNKHTLRKTFLEYLRKTGKTIIDNNLHQKSKIEKILNRTKQSDCDTNKIRLTKDQPPLTQDEILQLQNKISLVNPVSPLSTAFSSVIAPFLPTPKLTKEQLMENAATQRRIRSETVGFRNNRKEIEQLIEQDIGVNLYGEAVRTGYENRVNHAAQRSKNQQIYY